ncbi:hypothetical protein [Nostoc sp.]
MILRQPKEIFLALVKHSEPTSQSPSGSQQQMLEGFGKGEIT